jgi:hypothetical protein
MRCVSQIRANGVAPVPVTDACLHSHKDGPNTRRPRQSSRAADVHQSKNAREFEGGTLIGAEGPVSSGLNLAASNRNSQAGSQTVPARPVMGSLSPSGEAGTLGASRLESLDDYSVRQFLEFFEILDRWDREAHGN